MREVTVSGNIERETERAFLLKNDHGEWWIPKALARKVLKMPDKTQLTIPEWFSQKRNIWED